MKLIRIGAHIVRQLKSGHWAVCDRDENNVIARHETHSQAVADAESRRTHIPASNLLHLPRKPNPEREDEAMVGFCSTAEFRISDGYSAAVTLGKCATPRILLARIRAAEHRSSYELQIKCSDGKWLFPNKGAVKIRASDCNGDNIARIFSDAVLWIRHCNELEKIAEYVAKSPAKPNPKLNVVRD